MPTERRVVATRTTTGLSGKPHRLVLSLRFATTPSLSFSTFLMICQMQRNAANVTSNLQIISFDITLSHEEKWLYPDLDDPGRQLPSAHHTTKFHCIKKSSMKTSFPYYQPCHLEIPAEMWPHLKSSHLDLLKSELDYEPWVGISWCWGMTLLLFCFPIPCHWKNCRLAM